MSLSKTTLSDFDTHETPIETGDAEEDCDSESPPERPAWTPGDSSESSKQCSNCDATVTPDYHRFHCDNDGALHHCLNCVTQADMYNGAGAKPEFIGRCVDTGGAQYGSL